MVFYELHIDFSGHIPLGLHLTGAPGQHPVLVKIIYPNSLLHRFNVELERWRNCGQIETIPGPPDALKLKGTGDDIEATDNSASSIITLGERQLDRFFVRVRKI